MPQLLLLVITLFSLSQISSRDLVKTAEPTTKVVEPSANILLSKPIEQRPPLSLPLHQPKIVVKKIARRLLLYSGKELVRTYRVGLGLSPVGDKYAKAIGARPKVTFISSQRIQRALSTCRSV